MTTLTVSELTSQIKNILEPRFAAVSVRGEVTNLRQQSSGHLYFTLKDEGAQLSAVLFRGAAQGMTRLPKQGDEIVVQGQLSLYAPRGGYQILVREVTFAGVGDLLLRFHQMKERLAKEGLFAPEKKKALPPFPKTIGVVTSPSGSVIRDILHVLQRRHAGVNVILNPVRVQGKGAEVEIAMAIEQMNRFGLADLLIVGRGGGSIEDLWPFNEECVARAIHASQIPVISAVGHETDFSIADYAADVRAPTPSAAAEIAVREKGAQLEKLAEAKARIEYMLKSQVRHHRIQLNRFATHPFFATSDALLATRMQRLDELESGIATHARARLQEKRLKLSGLRQALVSFQPSQQVERAREKLERLVNHLAAINPKNVLQKGYCIPFAENSRSVILSSKDVHCGIDLLFHDGKVRVHP